MIYLDYNATSPLRPSVKAAMDALGNAPLNPSSVHTAGRAAKKYLEDARATIANALSAFSNEVLFVASGSEANNMVLRGFAATHTLLTSAIEHASISATVSLLGGAVIPVDTNGIVKLDMLEQMLAALNGKPALVSVMLANNETGVIQPIAELVAIARKHGALVHSDAVQALGKIPFDFGLLGVDMLTIAAHKAGGPVGAAALLIRNDLAIKPLISGGAQELGRRAGTVNVPAIVGFAQMVKEVATCSDAKQWREWRDWLSAELVSAVPDALVMGAYGTACSGAKPSPLGGEDKDEGGLNIADSRPTPSPNPLPAGERANRALPPHLPQTLCITMPDVKAETQLMNLDLSGFAVSAGAACSSGKIQASATLLAMGIPPEIAETAIRISWGWATTRAEIEAFAEAWKAMATRLCRAQQKVS
jgi:cysteine desulfurase